MRHLAGVLRSKSLQPSNAIASVSLSMRVLLQAAPLVGALISGTVNRLPLFLFLSAINGCIWSFWGWAGIGHEFYHRRFFQGSSINRWLFVICGVITWSNFGYFDATHRRHHVNTLGERDPEDQSDQFVPWRRIPVLMTFDIFGFTRRIKVLAQNATGIVPNAHVHGFSTVEQQAIVRAAQVVLIAHAAWLGLVILVLRSPEVLILTTFAPWIFRLPNVFLERIQHLHGTRGSSSVFETTRTLLLPKPIAWIYAGMNYHVEHHLFPFVPGYRLSRINQSILDQHLVGRSILRLSNLRTVVAGHANR